MFGATVHMCMPTTRWYIHIHNAQTHTHIHHVHVAHTMHVTVHEPGQDNDTVREPGPYKPVIIGQYS